MSYETLLEHPLVAHWFSDNWLPNKLAAAGGAALPPKLSLLPIGITDRRDGGAGSRAALLAAAACMPAAEHKPPRVLVAFHHSEAAYDWAR